MPLPVIEYPIIEIYVHSLDRKVKFRPLLVKEEKILLIAKESKEVNEIRTAVLQAIQNCTLEEVDIGILPLFDIEMIFVKLRAISAGESVQLIFNCKNPVSNGANEEASVCNTDTDYRLDLNKIKYVIPEGHSSTVMVTSDVGVKLKYPSLNQRMDLKDGDDEYEIGLKALANNIDYIFDKESIHRPEDITAKELISFLENLTVEKMSQIQDFYMTSPKTVLEDQVACKKCGYLHRIYTEDLISFFT